MKLRPIRTATVTGAKGWLGRRVCENLCRDGIRVTAMGRTQSKGPWHHFVEHDLSDPDSSTCQKSNLPPTDVVIHCAARVHTRSRTAWDRYQFHAVNTGGTETMLKCATLMGANRFIFISTIATYDWKSIHGSATEQSPAFGTTPYAESKLAAERLVAKSSLEYCNVRLATLFGSGDNNNFARLARALKSNRFVVPLNGGAVKSFICVDTAAHCVSRLATMQPFESCTMNLGSPEKLSIGQICDVFSATCGFPRAPRIATPLLKAAALVGDAAAMLSIPTPLTTDQLTKLLCDTIIRSDLAIRFFPKLCRHRFADRLEAAKTWYKTESDL